MEDYKPIGWHSRGYLPHFDGGEIAQFITFRLFDSMPQSVLNRWQMEFEQDVIENADVRFRKRIETYLDQGYGCCYLKISDVAEIVQNAIIFFDGEGYKLSAWVVMPNHIHLLVTPCLEHKLSKIIQSLKNYTARMSNRFLNRKGAFWQEDYFDRYIRDAEHFEKTVAYIENNPVKARLCKSRGDWKFGNAGWQRQVSEN